MTSTPTTCKNCGAIVPGNFCPDCGQKAAIHKITLKHLLHEFFHVLTHADKGFLFLTKQLITRPGYVAQEYLDGKRKKHFNPLTFFVVASTIWAIAVLNSGYFEAMGADSPRASYKIPAEVARYFSESMKIIISYGKIINLIISVPVLSLLTWLFFRKNKNTFAENLVLQCLTMGQAHLTLVIIFIPVFLLFGQARMNNNVYQLVFLAYLMVAYQQFFKNHVLLTIVKTIVILLLFIILFWLSIFTFVFVRGML